MESQALKSKIIDKLETLTEDDLELLFALLRLKSSCKDQSLKEIVIDVILWVNFQITKGEDA